MQLNRIVAVSIALLVVSACRGREREYPGVYGREVAEAIPRIEKASGLKFKEPPKVESRSRAQVREFVLSQLTNERAQKQLMGAEAAYKQLGMLPDTIQLQKFLVDLLEEQIIGYYDPKTKVLYVVEGADREAVGITISHELIHALQDQYISLDSIQNIEGDNDRSSAAQAVFEGQAVFEQIAAMGGKMAAANMPGGWDKVREMIRENQSQMPIFSSAPVVIQESLIFPYLSGAEFVKNFKDKMRDSLLYKHIPVSTEQILHPSAFFTNRDAPTYIKFGPVRNATVAYENTLGEFETRLFLFEHLQDQNEAVRGAAGWDGDRYLLVNTPTGRGIFWATVWDSVVDAGEFQDMLKETIRSRALSETRSITVTGGEVAGKPLVLYVDVPKGANPGIIDMSEIQLTGDK